MKTRLAKSAVRLALGLALIGAPVAASLAPVPAAAASLSASDKALVDKGAAYLEGLGGAKGRFIQTDGRGNQTQGTFYIKRPGKIRFEYDPPSGLLVVSDGKKVNIRDSRLKTFDSYPLSQTPLSVFLSQHIRLDRGVVVDQVRHTTDGFQVLARDHKSGNGWIALAFSDGPSGLRLREWTVVDAQGAQTRVQLVAMENDAGVSDGLFVLKNPKREKAE